MAEPQQASGPAEGWTWAAPSNASAPPPQSFLQHAVGPMPTGGDLPFSGAANPVGPKAREALNAPLVSVTGYAPVDALLTSPVSLALMAGGGIARIAKVATPLVRAVAAGEMSSKMAADAVGLLLGYRGEKGMRVVQGLRETLAQIGEKGKPPMVEAPPVPANATGTSWAVGPMPAATPAAAPPPAAAAPASPVASNPVAPAPPAAATVRTAGPPPPSAAPPPPVATPPKPMLLATEAKEYMRLVKAGKSPKEAMELIQAQREFAAKFGTPTSEQVRGSVTDRNATGRWKDEE